MDVILEVRRRYDVDNDTPSMLREATEQALAILSDQLYSTDTHFLMEFIQNAEDNEYANDEPTLCITVKDSAMILSCNELGFNDDNVRAICKIGGSTKKNKPGFIGEKGIGFKSVFKIADVVHVASGPYTFKFDREAPLGMLAPVWDASKPATPGWTTFHLELSQRGGTLSPGLAISDKINELRPSLLLFLKKLRSIELNVNIGSSKRTKFTRIQRRDLNADTIQLVRSDNGIVKSKDIYFVVRQVLDMSRIHESKRSGRNDTEVVLAFPVNEAREPKIIVQDVHAFLPLRMVGFRFVIQGDFLTSSNREDVLHDSLWNVEIRAAVVDVFIAAIQIFQERLRDTWFLYLPSGIVHPFFVRIEHDLLDRLAKMEIVRDGEGLYRHPNKVLFVPSRFLSDGRSLIRQEFMKRHYYLSDDYDTSRTLPILRRLGVRDMSLDDFLLGLAEMTPASLEECADSWHEIVCLQLSRVPRPRWGTRFDSRILKLRIIPLDNGTWAHAYDADKFMFESVIRGIPDHIDFRRVHRRVGPDSTPERYSILRALGVNKAEPSFIAQKILDHIGRLSVQAHIDNALFFFTHRIAHPELPSPAGRLQLVDEHGNTDVSKKLYIDLPCDNGKLRKALPSSARFIHPEYLHQLSGEEHKNWIGWLSVDLQLNSAPRLIGMKLSSEFKEMLKTLSLSELLDVLRYFWNRWSMCSAAPWHEELKQHTLRLDDGMCCTLGSTVLKRGSLARYPRVPFLPISDPESKDWDFLGQLGVTTEVGVPFFVKLLVRYSDEALDNEAAIKNIYKQLDVRFDEDAKLICDAFVTKALIFVPRNASRASSWTHLSDVYWIGSKYMTSNVSLSDVYPDLCEFFQEKLGMSDAPPRILVDELKCISRDWLDQAITGDVSRKVMDMLSSISDLIEEKRLNEVDVQNLLKEYSIFPSRSGPTELRLRKLQDIYVPDCSGRYAEAFRNKVPILEFSLGRRHRPTNIDHLLQLAPEGLVHDLEKCVAQKVNPRGERELDSKLTMIFGRNYNFVKRVVYSKTRSRPSQKQIDLLSKVRKIAVFFVDGISSSLHLANHEPITVDNVLVHLSEDEHSMAVLVNKMEYSDLKTRDRIKVEVCKCLADMLDCDFNLLMLCMTLEADALESVLEMQGILCVDDSSTDDDAWVLSHGRSNGTSRELETPTYVGRSAQCPQANDSISTNTVIQENFSMRLRDEIECIADMLSGFSLSSLHAVCPTKSTSEPLQDFSREVVRNRPGSTMNEAASASVRNSAPSTLDTGFSGVLAQLENLVSHGVSSQYSPHQQVNGFLGERYIYELLSAIIGETYSFENWTSELRGLDPRFDDFNGCSLADITFDDEDGILTSKFYKEDTTMLEKWTGRYPTYHIEVKSTSAGSREPFRLSKRQLEGAFRLTQCGREQDLPEHVYVIARVWNVRRPTVDSHRFYVDPIRCILDGKLKIVSETVEFILGD